MEIYIAFRTTAGKHASKQGSARGLLVLLSTAPRGGSALCQHRHVDAAVAPRSRPLHPHLNDRRASCAHQRVM